MAMTYGSPGQPLSSTYNYDALVATSLANFRGTLIDNIATSNVILKLAHDKGMWEHRDGGLHLTEDLMYGLAPVQWYNDHDELITTPTEGITQAQYEWANMSSPFTIGEIERKKNKHRIIDLVASKLEQSSIGIREGWSKAFVRGSLAMGGSDIRVSGTDPITGAIAINPLPMLISYTPNTGVVGGIDRSVAGNSWWRNVTKTSAATTYLQFLKEVLNLYHTCARGSGGPPDWMLCDQETFELFQMAYFNYYRTTMREVGDMPFPTVKFQNALVSWDEYVPNVAANASAGSIDTSVAGGGTLYMGNSKFLKISTESETDFVWTDQMKPYNQRVDYKFILWMGNACINNARKFGVLGNIARVMT